MKITKTDTRNFLCSAAMVRGKVSAGEKVLTFPRFITPKRRMILYFLPMLLMIGSSPVKAQLGYTIQCPPDEIVNCDTDLTPGMATLTERDTIQIASDDNIFYGTMDTESYADNPSLVLPAPTIPAGTTVTGVEMNLSLLVVGNSCEEDIDIRVTDPMGNVTEFINPISGCEGNNNNTLYLVSEVLDATGLEQGNFGDWVIQMKDSNDQNTVAAGSPVVFVPPGTEFSFRFGTIRYFTEKTEQIPFTNGPAINGEPNCSGTEYTYTYQTTVPNGDILSCEQTFTINNTPTITCPADAIVTCSADISVNVANASFTAGCGTDGTLSLSGPVLNGSADTPGATYTYTYTVEDACGEMASCEQVFTIDNSGPDDCPAAAPYTIECPPDEMVDCEANLTPGTAIFTEKDTIQIISDQDIYYGTMDTESYADNPSLIFEAPVVPQGTTVTGGEMNLFLLVLGNSCEQDIDIRVTNPLGSITEFISPIPGCEGNNNNTLYRVSIPLDAAGLGQANFGDWVIQMRDSDDQNAMSAGPPAIFAPPGTEFSFRFGTIQYFVERMEEVPFTAGPAINGEPNCPGTEYTYTYEATAPNGEVLSCEQTLTIDNLPLTITCPADETVACAVDIVVDPSSVSFTTGCEVNGTVNVSDPVINGDADCPGTTYTYTYMVEDDCGRTASCEQVFTIENGGLTITCPAGETVTCADDIVVGTADFETSCGLGGSIFTSGPAIDGEPNCPGTTYTYTFTAVDACGRQVDCNQVFTIQNELPTITCPDDMTISCSSEIAVAIPTFNTTCGLGGGVSVDGPVVDGTPDCSGTTYTFTFTGTDDCGRTASCEQVFTIENSAPTISCSADETVSCAADILADASNASFTTSCDLDANVSVSDPVINGEADCPGTTYTYTYTVEDACGGTASCEQIFTIENVEPTISCPADETVSCSGDISVNANDATFVTSCDLAGNVSVSSPVIDGDADCPGTTYTYTYTIEDVCGRTASCEQIFTIENTTLMISCPADQTAECGADIAANVDDVTFLLGCDLAGDVSVSGPVINGEADCPGTTYTYTYTVEDACGRTASCEQTFTIESPAPTITCPPDATVACLEEIEVDANDATFTTSCGLGVSNITVINTVVDGATNCPGTTYTYTYTVQDACGRTASCNQVFTIENIEPTITCPADETVACANEIVVGEADFETSCELNGSVFVSGPAIDGEPDCPGTTYTYTFTGIDACGRQVSCNQVFTIGNDAPEIACPEDMTVACSSEIAVAIPTFSTTCGLGGSVSVDGPVIDGEPDCPGTTYIYTFTGTDDCGRTVSCEQVFTIENEPPTISCPADETVACASDISVNANDATFTTSCDLEGNVSVSEPVISGDADCPGTTYTYTYTLEDACGRTATCEQIFTIENSAPTISCPADATVACATDITVDANDATFITSCDLAANVSVSSPVIDGDADCPGTTYTYTYTVEDACGRIATCEQIFTIENAVPTISCPADETVGCSADITVNANDATFTTSCELGGNVSISDPVINGELDCSGTTYTYTYTVEDACGRTASCEQVFTIESAAPTISCPADATVGCSADIIIDANDAIFTTSCDLGTNVSLSDPVINGTADCPGTTYTYTYTIEDACGSTASCEQIFTIENDAPTITCPADETVECADEIVVGEAVFETSCDLGGSVFTSGPVIDGEPDCPGTTYTYTFTGVDACGRQVNCNQVFTIDNEAPEIVCPEDMTVSCSSEIAVAIPTFSTTCGLGGSVSVDGPAIDGEPDCPGTTYIYTFTGTDDCGRTVSCEQVFTIENEPPTISCPADETVACASDISVNANDATFTTSCDLEGNVSVSEPVINGDADCPGTTYTYTYTVEDACGRTATCEQVFTVENVAPTITCPADETVACATDISVDANDATFITSCDLSGNVSVSGPVIDGDADCPGTTYTYTYTVEDACGRTATCEQVFTIENSAPTISCPADETVECASDILVDANNATFTTSCELGANVSVSEPIINGTPDCPGTTYTYTYTVEDACGRTASCEQVFTIENDEPTITCPADETVECSADILVDANNAIFTTSCDLAANVSVSDPVINGTADCPGTTYTYTYTVEDACGRTVSCEQIFTIENDTPTITCPADETVECADEIVVGEAVFETSCDLGGSVFTSGPVIDGEPDCPGTTYTYTFTGVDACGRQVNCSQVFTIDNEAPEIVCPEDMTVSCSSEIAVAIPTFSTTCGLGGSVSVDGPAIDGEPDCPGTTYIYTFTGTDDCGRTVSCEQVFTIENEPPTISCPADETVACASDISLDANDATFTTSCDLAANVSVSEPVINGDADCPGTTYTYTYTVEDACGRTATCEQIFTIENVAPTITCPADETVACATDITVDANDATFITSCDLEGNVSVSGPVIDGEADCPGTTYTYTYTVEDACGRTATCEQIFTIENSAPTISCPADETLTCASDILVDANNATFTTSCDLEGNVSVSEPIINGTPDCPGTTYTYTYTVEDTCGRTASCEQVFTIENDEPTITCPADETVECAADILVDANNAIFTTSCDLAANVSVSNPVINGTADCPGTTYTYTYTVEDACGRTVSCEQIFTIENDAPTITCPADETVECADEIVVGEAVFETSCDLDGSVFTSGPIIDGEPDCPGTTYTYTFTGVDACGRQVNCSQVFTIENEAPEIVCPEDMTVTCSSEIAVAIPTFSTTCGLGGSVSVDGPAIDGEPDCPGTTYIYTFTGTDDCGRTVSCEQVFTIENEPPTISCPADETVACASDISLDANDATFTTSCDLAANVSVSEPVINGDADCPGTTYTYTYTVEDACGRTATCEQIFTIENVAPTITCPADETVACASDITVDANDATFITSCDLEGNVSVSGPVIDSEADCPGTTYTYTYTVEDACGRTATCEQVFTIENSAPTISCPADETVTCAADILVDANNATFTTSCDLEGNVSVSEPVINGDADCPGTTYTYTYTIEDACWRTASCEQVFTIENDEPTITCPADETVECSADILVDANDAIFATSCDLEGNVSVSEPVINGEADCPGTTYTYTYTIEDACWRTASCEQVFTIENDEPTITCPADETVECADEIVVGEAVFETSCDLGGSVFTSGPVIDGEPDCPGTTYTYTFTGVDACGRQVNCSQVFTIDNEAPEIACPEDMTVTCSSEIAVAIPTFSTTCGLGGSVSVDGPMIDGEPDCPGTTYTYTFTGTDDCGRTVSCEQVFTIENEPPTISCPADETVACATDITVDANDATFTTSCDLEGNVSVSGPVINGEADCPGTSYVYTYTVEDVCGRTATCEQIFTIENDAPTISCPIDATVSCAADIMVDANDATFITSCELAANVSVSGPVIDGTADCPGTTYTYTYTVEDVCGRTASCEQVFTIENSVPTISCPADETVFCSADIIIDATNASFTTSCGLGANVNVSEPVINGEPDCTETTYTYTYTVEDDCGRTASCEQVFTIENAVPRIICPINETVSCSADISVDANDASFTISCGVDSNVSVSEPIINGEPDCPGTTYTYVYTIEDACGRTASCGQIFTIENTGPNISCPVDTTVTCAADIVVGTEDFETSCGLGGSVFVSGPVIDGEPDCPGTTYSYTFTGVDTCGRQVNCGQVFTIENEPPTIVCAPDTTVSCSAEIGVEIPILDTGCQLGGSVSVSDPVIDGVPDCNGTTYTYTFIGTDDCGRAVSCEQVFTIQKEELVITCPAGDTVACEGDILLDDAPIATAGCSIDFDIERTGPVIDGEPNCVGTTYTYTYTATDACGETSSCEQVFTIANDLPIISCPADTTVACASDIIIDTTNISITTSCDIMGNINVSEPLINGEADCPGTTYTYTYTVEDACGRTATCEQIFTIENDEPTIICPADTTVACAADIIIDTANVLFETTCDVDGVITVSEPLINGEADCPETTYTYTYTVEDACGRTATCEQIFTIENDEPTISCPPDEMVACLEDIEVDANDANFTTSCGLEANVSVLNTTVQGATNCPGTTYTYRYTVTDDCGRTAFCDQVFTIDNAEPTITCPADTTVACAADIVLGTPGFGLSCNLNGSVFTSGPVIDGEPDCPGTTYTYTFTGADACGRQATCTQVFTIDNAEPTITCPADLIIFREIDIVIDTANVLFTTSCDLGATISVSDPVLDGEPENPGTTYTYTYTVEDACGRTASCEQVFTIDDTPPTITCPADTMAACSTDILVDAANASFTTTCNLGANVRIEGPLVNGDENCSGTTYTYIYTVEDSCGRAASCEQIFTIEDIPPTISCPANVIIFRETDIVIDTVNVVFTTSCNEAIMSVNGPVLDGEPDASGTTYTYTYTVEDACGRTVSCEQMFIIDDTPPMITCPADTTVTCVANILVDAANASFTTTCNLGANVSVEGPVINGNENCSGTIYTYIYTMEDNCGRTASCEQVFTIENAEPTITCPADTTVACATDILIDVNNVLSTTSCDGDANVSVEGPIIDGEPNCVGTTYTYTYTAKDVCGRSATCEQVFTINDTPLTVSCPIDTTVACAEDISVDVNDATFSASCELGVDLSLSGPIIDGDAGCNGTTYTYTYTAKDVCGTTVSCDQVFTITNDRPTIVCPEGCPVTCASDIRLGTPEFTTSCGVAGTLTMTGPVIDGEPGANGTTYTYTHTVTDDCGGMTSCDQIFTIVNDCQYIDFDFDNAGNQLLPGTEIFDQYEDFTITTENPQRCAQLFDTGNPTSDDFDMGTPNEQYGGPGIGDGGMSNTEFQGNALIVSQDCSVPNETTGQLIFTFDCGVTIKTVDILDINCTNSEIELYDENNNLIEELPFPDLGINSFNEFDVFVSGVYTMIIDLDCGGGVTGFTYCKDNTPGANCDAPLAVCEDYNLDFSNPGYNWTDGNFADVFDVEEQTYSINITDNEGIVSDIDELNNGLAVRMDPTNVDDEVIITYNLSLVSDNVSFDIFDIDYKETELGGQQEEVCIYGLLGNDPTQISPTITPLNGGINVDGNCAVAAVDPSPAGQNRNILVEFSACIDQVIIIYGAGADSPVADPDDSKIVIGQNTGFNSQVCPGSCTDCPDDDGDGVCNDADVCPGGNDNADQDGNGIPDACDDICYDYNIDLGDCGAAWGAGDISGNVALGEETINITIVDEDNIIDNTQADGTGLLVRSDPQTPDDEVVIYYNLSKSSDNVVFDITDIDFKPGDSGQEEEVCVYGTLGGDPTQILPIISSLDGSVNIDGNCAVGGASSTVSGDDESVLVEFTTCIDKITIVYGTGTMSPADPDNSKIVIGGSIFSVEQCKEACGAIDNEGLLHNEIGQNNRLDIREEPTDGKINLYPNPIYGNGDVTIEIDTETRGAAQVVLTDAFGRIVSTKDIELVNDITLHKLNTNPLAAGVYFVQLHTQEWRTDGMKLVVVKP